MTTAQEMFAAVTDGSRPFGEVLALAIDYVGEPTPCRFCERNLYFGDTTCASCLLLLALSARALRAAQAGGPRYLLLLPDGSSQPMAQRVQSEADSVCVDLRAPLFLQLKTAARLRRPDILGRSRAERAGN